MTEETPPANVQRWQANLDTEIDGIALYHMLAAAEKSDVRRSVFLRMAAVEAHHADVWRERLRRAGVEPREHGPSQRVRLLGLMAKAFGVRAVLPMARMAEAGAYDDYMSQDAQAQAMAPDEREHQRILSQMELRTAAGPASDIAAREGWHRTGGGGTLRASIFGVSDGLVSNTSLIMGFAGAQTGGNVVVLAGVAGLLAGAFSMAVGEYVSMRAQRELFERQIEIEQQEIEEDPQEEGEELALIYEAKGFPRAEAESVATRLMQKPEAALETLIHEELGLDPGELGSPWGAATGSFLAFGTGALIPLIPFLFSTSIATPVVILSAALSAIAAFGVGAAISLVTGRSVVRSGARQLGLAAAAAALTFTIGRIIDVSIGVS